ncbi:ANK_REP_REGION domain-containing protein [Trichonephila inaurata madagascariensis]|uniref:ANK_REP_REGION domain-containing protein n=1 Tax=Trichonephila inaurata madagascariensis TaxID=2747483 RepID=A0A8X6XG91_9ARAC|nr:ANK_REP_REGION domain-containing protein [Trichonephila inaurata madagascariensis]
MHNKVPMLKFLTSTRTVRILWSEYNVKNSMAEYFLERDQSLEKWNSIEESLELKIENDLILPKTLKILLSSLVKPIGGRINHVIRQIYDNKYLPNHFMSMISWTILGIIDEKKTAEAVIKDENLSLTKRYEIACTYCLENEIPMLWSKLPKENKTHYFDARAPLYTFPIYWAYHMKMELNILDKKIQEKFPRSSNSHCFGVNFAFATVNLPAFEYFLGKFNAKEKDTKFQAFFRYLEVTEEARSIDTYTCDITYFLLSQMNENQRTYIFKNYAFYILKRFLEFPYQGFFLEIESIMLKNLTDDNKEALKSHELYKETGKYFVFRTYSKNNALWNF